MLVLRQIFLYIVLKYVQTQYHQSDYGIKLERMNLTNYNRSYFSNVQATLTWFNRTQRAINASGYIIKELVHDIRVEIQVYKFLSNEYRYFPITLSGCVCDTIEKNLFGTQKLLKKYSNLKCPAKPGWYYLRNAVIDFSTFPPYIPGGQYKLTALCYHGSDFVVEVHFYGVVTTFITKWEN